MNYQDDNFSPNNNPGPGASAGAFVDPQQLVQLLLAARAAQQVGQTTALVQNAALQNAAGTPGMQAASPAAPAATQLPAPWALGPTDPFVARAFGLGAASSQGSVPPPDRVPLKAAAVQSARQAQGSADGGAQAGVEAQPNRQATQRTGAQPQAQQQAPDYDSTSASASGTTVTLRRLRYGSDPNMGGTMTTETRTGTHAFRDNNPGNIEYGAFAKANGAVGQDGRFAIFPTAEAGLQALQTLLMGSGYRNLSVDAAIARYAPPSENDTAAYQAGVRRAVGVTGETLISSLTADQLQRMIQAIARIEGFQQQGTVRTSRTLAPNYP
jgi:hypothetical protein